MWCGEWRLGFFFGEKRREEVEKKKAKKKIVQSAAKKKSMECRLVSPFPLLCKIIKALLRVSESFLSRNWHASKKTRLKERGKSEGTHAASLSSSAVVHLFIRQKNESSTVHLAPPPWLRCEALGGSFSPGAMGGEQERERETRGNEQRERARSL